MRSRRRILFVVPTVVGREMSAVGMRHYEMARALSTEFDTSLAVSRLDGDLLPDVPVQEIGRESHLLRMVEDSDVVVVQGDLFRRYPGLRPPKVPLVVDMTSPTLLEELEHRKAGGREAGEEGMGREAAEYDGHLWMVRHLLRTGDFFLCGSERQRDLLLGMLLAQGRLNPQTYREDPAFEGLAAVVPNGVCREGPETSSPSLRDRFPSIRRGDVLLYWGGGLWDWLDPEILIDALAEVGKRRDGVKLVFSGTRHPDDEVSVTGIAGRAMEKAREAGMLGKTVFFVPWVPYRDRGGFLVDADIGVSAHGASMEARFAVRTRIMDYLWAGLPIITTDGDEAAEIVRREGLGEVVAPGDVSGWVEAILGLAGNVRRRRSCGRKSKAVGEGHLWEGAVAPLAEFCRNPRRAADRLSSSDGGGRLGGMLRRHGRKALALASERKFSDILRGVRWRWARR